MVTLSSLAGYLKVAGVGKLERKSLLVKVLCSHSSRSFVEIESQYQYGSRLLRNCNRIGCQNLGFDRSLRLGRVSRVR